MEMGYQLSPEDAQRSYVEVLGSMTWCENHDILDKLEAAARAEVDQRHPDRAEQERAEITKAVSIGALRYFMVKFARNTIIAFDFNDALSFEGETEAMYPANNIVRIRGIWRKGVDRPTVENSALTRHAA